MSFRGRIISCSHVCLDIFRGRGEHDPRGGLNLELVFWRYGFHWLKYYYLLFIKWYCAGFDCKAVFLDFYFRLGKLGYIWYRYPFKVGTPHRGFALRKKISITLNLQLIPEIKIIFKKCATAAMSSAFNSNVNWKAPRQRSCNR